MLCKNCGTELNDNLKFCPSCGTSNESYGAFNQQATNISQASEVVNPVEVTPVSQPTPEVTAQSMYNQSIPVQQPSVQAQQPSVQAQQQNVQTQQQNVQTQQPMNGVQTNMGVQQPYMNNANNGKKNNSLIFIIIGIIVAAVVCVVIVLNANKDSDEDVNSNSNVTSNSNVVSNSNVTSNTPVTSNSNVTSNTTTANAVTFNGYVLQIPKTFTSSISTTSSSPQLQLIGTNNVDVAVIGIQDGSYETIKASQSTIETYMKNSGYNVTNVQVKTYNGVEFITAEVSQSDQKMILGYAKLDTNKIFMVVTANTNNTVDYTILNQMATIVKTAKVAA